MTRILLLPCGAISAILHRVSSFVADRLRQAEYHMFFYDVEDFLGIKVYDVHLTSCDFVMFRLYITNFSLFTPF